ncbi:hypothetical protein CMK11_12445 [Candidatus Poribacteria bacterium]|nr:hypothetical protein [Candidatus Poribacteria bacterium]
MAGATREDMRQLVDSLPEDDLAAAWEALQAVLNKGDERVHAERNSRLLSAGVLVSVAQGMTAEEYWDYTPVAVRGEPLSDTVIRERR